MKAASHQVLSATTIVGDPVENAQGESLGKIEELMIDLDRGSIAYAVLSFGGVLGIGDKLFAVPWEALSVDTTDKKVRLDVNKERLEDAPGFDKDHWPSAADQSFLDQVYAYYEVTPYHEQL
jgi:sporulation protein YlmC with PRC-barrel domain